MKFRYYNPTDNTMTYSEGFQLSKFFEMFEDAEGAVLMRSMGALDDNQKEVYQGDKFNGFGDTIQYYSVDVDEGNTNMSLFINGVRYLWGTFESGKQVLENYDQFKVQGNIYQK